MAVKFAGSGDARNAAAVRLYGVRSDVASSTPSRSKTGRQRASVAFASCGHRNVSSAYSSSRLRHLSSAAGESTTMALLLASRLAHLPAWARTKLSAKELEALLCLRSRAMLPFRRAIVPAGSHQVFASQRDARSTRSAAHPLR